MNIEYEATFVNIKKEEMRKLLKKIGAKLIKKEYLQRRIVFDLPKGHEIKGGWLRVREEADKITMSLKVVNGSKIENQKEICLEVNNFAKAESFLSFIGCKKKAYQENKRELWLLDNIELALDEWPFLEPFLEIGGENEEQVRKVAEKLGLKWKDAIFGSVDILYSKKYNIPAELICNKIPKITFHGKNPFLKNKKR